MIAFLDNLALPELFLAAIVAVMVFGRRLPQVLAKVFVQVQRARRGVSQVWRETGIGQEMRSLQRELDESMPEKVSPLSEVRRSVDDFKVKVTRLDQLGVEESAPPQPEALDAEPPTEAGEDAEDFGQGLGPKAR